MIGTRARGGEDNVEGAGGRGTSDPSMKLIIQSMSSTVEVFKASNACYMDIVCQITFWTEFCDLNF